MTPHELEEILVCGGQVSSVSFDSNSDGDICEVTIFTGSGDIVKIKSAANTSLVFE
jgi:hypothetical protein